MRLQREFTHLPCIFIKSDQPVTFSLKISKQEKDKTNGKNSATKKEGNVIVERNLLLKKRSTTRVTRLSAM